MSIPVEVLKTAAMLGIGVITGFILCAAGFCESKNNGNAARLEDNKLILTILYALFFGVIMIQTARFAGFRISRVELPGVGICALGGVLCGTGFAVAKCGVFSGIAGIGCGKLYFLWVLSGMVIALGVISYVRERIPGVFECRVETERVFSAVGTDIFVSNNPALYAVCGLAALIILTSFLKGK